ncbi:hypothetical protein WG904_01115 [Pedobacter sp. Du54]|uniref:hypothetical protein n=1 Tax=Pedobacter anseongensis TaxID=3133439 RepID=UPI0030A02378
MNRKLSLLIAALMMMAYAQNTWAQTTVKAPISKSSRTQNPVKKPLYTRKAYRVDTVKNTDFSLNGQYQFMLSRSKTINGYKLINPGRLAGVWQSALDTLKKERTEFKSTKNKLAEQEKTIVNLQAQINGQEDSLNTSNAKLNEISFLGMSLEKGTYHTIVWSIIVLLAIGLVVVIARSSKNISEAKHRTALYDEITAEYQAFKSKANEQQRKLARALQDERNIVEELKNKS